jgi:methanogenic corrinoid protein MtbC1
VLFLPEGQHHELGLLYVYYLLRKKGIATIYLGANVPLKDIQYILRVKAPEYLYLHLTSYPLHLKFTRYVQQLLADLGQTRIVLSGHLAQTLKRQDGDHVILLQSLSGVQAYIDDLNA